MSNDIVHLDAFGRARRLRLPLLATLRPAAADREADRAAADRAVGVRAVAGDDRDAGPLPRDGSSQSTITVTARDAQGKPLAGQRVTLGCRRPTAARCRPGDVVTGSDGRATFDLHRAAGLQRSATRSSVVATPVGAQLRQRRRPAR